MNTANPDKHIRKEIYDRIHNMEVGGQTFKCFDDRATSSNTKNYFLLSTQLNQPNRTKCGRGWINSTEIQVVTRQPKNHGSRVLLDDAVNGVLEELDGFTLPTASGMKVSLWELSIDNELSQEAGGEIVRVKILRLETTIN
jgi:hypothetical protein